MGDGRPIRLSHAHIRSGSRKPDTGYVSLGQFQRLGRFLATIAYIPAQGKFLLPVQTPEAETTMNANLIDVVSWVFFAANGGRILAYVPQLVAAWKCENGAKSVSRMTWGYFAFAHFTGVAYALLVIDNYHMGVVFLGNFVVCCLLVGIVTWKKSRHGHRKFHPPTLRCVGGLALSPEAVGDSKMAPGAEAKRSRESPL